MNTLKQFLILLLMVIAAVVFCGLLLRQDMWAMICLYWFVLTVKNLIDWRDTIV